MDTVVVNPTEPPATSTNPCMVPEVEMLQGDLRLLLRHAARRRDRSVRMPQSEAVCGYAGLLAVRPADIAADPAKLESLYAAVDALTACTAPANVNSIRLTCAYLQCSYMGALPPGVQREASWVRWLNYAANAIGIIAFVIAVILLIFVDQGRREVQNLQAHRDKFLELVKAADDLRAGHQANGVAPAELWCQQDGKTPPGHTPQSIQEIALCNQMNDLLLKQGLDYIAIGNWNNEAERLEKISPLDWFLSEDLPSKQGGIPDLEQWQRTELRTAIYMSALTGFIIPLLLGFVGASISLFRTINDRICTWTLESGDGHLALVRVLLGGMMGGLAGGIWTNGDTVSLQGFTLTLGAVGLLVGFATDIVFGTLDRLLRLAGAKIGNSPQPGPTAKNAG